MVRLRLTANGSMVALAIASVVIASIVVALSPLGQGDGQPAPAHPPMALLVLPFTHIPRDSTANYLAEGLTEDLIAALRRAAPVGTTVFARKSSMSFENDLQRVQGIAGSIGATHVVEGSLRTDGGTMRVDVRLIDGPTGAPFWTGTYDDRETITDRLVRDLVVGIGSALERHFSVNSAEDAVVDVPSRDAFLRGRYLMNQQTLEGTSAALPYLDAALVGQPDYTDALAAIGEANFRMGQMRLARDAVTAALELDSTHGEANRVLGNILLYEDWDFAGALRAYDVAIRNDPTPAIRHSYAFLLAYIGRGAEAVAQLDTALAEDPRSAVLHSDLGLVAHMLSQHTLAIDHCNRALELSPGDVAALDCLTAAYLGLGMTDSALTYVRAAWTARGRAETLLAPGDSDPRYQLRTWRDRDLEILEQTSQGSAAGVRRARLYMALGDTTSALQLLQGAVFTRQPAVLWLGMDPAFDGLRGTSLFQTLLTRIGLPRSDEALDREGPGRSS